MKTANLHQTTIHVRFPYDPSLVQEMRALEGRKWNSLEKRWEVPVSSTVIEKLTSLQFTLSEDLKGWQTQIEIPVTIPPIDWENLRLKKTPYDFQKEGVTFLESHKGRGLVADEMGLGKTIQALTYLQLHPELRPAIIVCPASLKLNWEKEWKELSDSNHCEILKGKIPYKTEGEILIINYDILSAWSVALKNLKPQIIIFDEAHYMKERTSQRTKAAKELCKGIPHVIALTGTPILNRPVEIFNTLQILDPNRWGSFWKFAQKYCAAYQSRWGWVTDGASNTEDLYKLLTKTIMIRRKKQDVLTQLPPKTRSVIPLEISNRKEYSAAEDDFLGWLFQKDKAAAIKASYAETLVKMEILKQLSAIGKMEQTIHWVRTFIENGQKLVLFCTHKIMIDLLMKEFSEIAVKVDGSVTGEDRQKAVEKFQTDPSSMLFIGNIKAAGVGLTLTAASNVAFLEYPWTPGELVQAEDRVHRIGQEAESVNVWYLIAINTIEDTIIKLLDKKRKVVDVVIDGGLVDETSLIGELLTGLLQKGE